jgi:ABC-type transport system involved in multi-copper enzyme maturation permease subunit
MLPFGPVFWHDLRRMSRRQRYRWLCCLLALGMLAALAVTFNQQMAKFENEVTQRLDKEFYVVGSSDRIARLSAERARTQQEWRKQGYQDSLVRTGEGFFVVFMVTQWIVLLCLTPAVVAGAIAEEKEKRTVDYLFTTHLTSREIIAGKLLSRMWLLTMLLLAGVPVLCMAFSFGGIVPELLWGGFLVTFVMMLSLASVSILHSVLARKVRQAILNSYLTIGGYLLAWGVLEVVLKLMQRDRQSPMLMQEFLAVFNLGNPFVMVLELRQHFQTLGYLGSKPLMLLLAFLVFHGVVILVCLTVAVLRMRVACLRDRWRRGKTPVPAKPQSVPQEETSTSKPLPGRPRRRPPVGDKPLFWKECYAERTFKFGPLGKAIMVVSLLALAAPAFVYCLPLALIIMAHGVRNPVDDHVRDANAYLCWTGAILVTWVILAMSVRAATCISSERERQTWESLRAAPIALWRILLVKCFACWWSVRWLLLLFVAMCVSIIVAGGMQWACLPLLLAQLLAWGCFFPAWGLWLSVRCKSPVTAMALTILLLVVCSGLPWLAYLWDKEAKMKPSFGHRWLERLSPSYGMRELCLTKADMQWKQPSWRKDPYSSMGTSPRGDHRTRPLDHLEIMTLTNVFPLLLLAGCLSCLAYYRLRRESRF